MTPLNATLVDPAGSALDGHVGNYKRKSGASHAPSEKTAGKSVGKTPARRGAKHESSVRGAIKLLEKSLQDDRLKESGAEADKDSLRKILSIIFRHFKDDVAEHPLTQEDGNAAFLNRMLNLGLKVKGQHGVRRVGTPDKS